MSFAELFHIATGHSHFPWQLKLFEKFVAGEFPSSATIPTGLGKTSVVAVWLIALALHPEKVPRRLVYVVNRRTVVDQTTAEVESLRKALVEKLELKKISDNLRHLCALPLPSPDSPPLAISTLRGQFADNREWSADPARPAVIIGTVDMIGSGLLFSRYTVGFKLRPHHAAFLAQDALLVHDEAHLEPAFQKLLDSIVTEQARSNDPRKLHVIELSATTRSDDSIKPFRITEDDENNNFVLQRLNAVKKLSLVTLGDGEKDHEKIIELAIAHKESGRTILVFVRSVESATKIAAELGKKAGSDKVLTLTGTMRGKERDELITKPVFKRFLPKGKNEIGVEGTIWLVATSAGEVGVNISADDLICDLSTYESMAQRFGRVNRFGERDNSTITVVYPKEFPHAKKISDAEKAVTEGKKDADKKLRETQEKEAVDIAIEHTLALLRRLGGDASPAALEQLPSTERADAFSPHPQIRVATAIQFDAWALTSINKPISARPPVAPYLHGEAEWQPPQTHVAWREELDVIQGGLQAAYPPEELLEDFPLKPHELLRDRTDRIVETLGKIISKRQMNHDVLPDAWLLNEFDSLRLIPLSKFAYASKAKKDLSKAEETELDELRSLLANATIILPKSLGGVSKQGLLAADAVGDTVNADVSEIENTRLRIRAASPAVPDQYAADYRLIRAIDTLLVDEHDEVESPTRYWLWLEAKNTINSEKRATTQPETLETHTRAIAANAAAIAEKLLGLPAEGEPDLCRCLLTAAEQHDIGKNRHQWQLGIGNTAYDPDKPKTILAKSGGSMRPRNLAENYRHEFGSLADAGNDQKFSQLSDDEKDIALHLVAAHHGRARPYFPAEEVFDYGFAPDDSAALAAEVPSRFARLQHRFGRWGLAWLESLLRAADYAASAGMVADNSALPACCHAPLSEKKDKSAIRQDDKKTTMLRVDVANPGQFFACCGLFELASRIAPDTLAYFKQEGSTNQWRFIIIAGVNERSEPALTLQSLLEKITAAEITAIEPADATSTPLHFGAPFDFRIDWWKTATADSSGLKVWAGSMEPLRIALAMRDAINVSLQDKSLATEAILFDGRVAYDPGNPAKKTEPFYFDAKRGPNADSRDVGFSPNSLHFETIAAPAVELLCLVGLQRAMPAPTGRQRQFVYNLWTKPLPVALLAAAINGQVSISNNYSYRFESWFRTSQKKHKAFLQATPTDKRTNR